MGLLDFLKKKRKLRAIFIDEVGNVIIKNVKYQNNIFSIKDFGEEKMAYIIDHNFIVYDKKSSLPISFYYKNNPNPIRIQHERNDEVDGIGFQRILDSKTIQDLFTDEGLKKITLLMVLMIISLVLTLIVLLAQFGVIKIAATGG